MTANVLRGGCHCGALEVEFHSEHPPEEIAVRACQCAFCRVHAALSISDPAGRVIFRVRRPGALVRYRFGLRLADFLICRECGAYVGAFMPGESDGLAVVNINTFAERDRFGPVQPMTYDGETIEQRLERRRQRWMPARVEMHA